MSLNEGPSRILVVDGEEGTRRVIAFILKREGYGVCLAASGKEALAQAAGGSPDLVVLDSILPDLNGLLVCKKLRSEYVGPVMMLSRNGNENCVRWGIHFIQVTPTSCGWAGPRRPILPDLNGLLVCKKLRSEYVGPVMMLSRNGHENCVIEALENGADDCVVKPIRPAELLARVRALLRRYRVGSRRPAVIEVGDLEVNLAKRRVFRRGREIRFTSTEFDILVCLAQNQEQVVTSKMILDQVWGPSHGEYLQTLRVHVGHLRQKLEPNPSSPRYIMTEPGIGYRFAVSSPAVAPSL